MDLSHNLNHKFAKVEVQGKTEVIMMSDVIRISIYQIVEKGDNIDRTEVGLGMNKIMEEGISEVMQGSLRDKTAEENIEIITEMNVMKEEKWE